MKNQLIFYLKKIQFLFGIKKKMSEIYPYRAYLFQELVSIYGLDHFKNKRLLEIGPKEGDDTKRLLNLLPSEYILFDLPDKKDDHKNWIHLLNKNNKLLIDNFLYISKEEYEKLGKFDLIYFTGVLYHNPEQLRFIKKLYDKLNNGGILVLETATVRNLFLKNKNVVEVWYPNTYRNTSTITHLPSKKAVLSWLRMVGFEKVYESNCYSHENYNIKDIRFACIAEKTLDSTTEKYYKKQISSSDYYIGGST